MSSFSPYSKWRAHAHRWAVVHEQSRWCPQRFWSATVQKGIVPIRTHQEPSPRLQQNDKHCLITYLLKALLVNGSLGKTVNTRHAVQLPKSSALLCAWAKPGSRRNRQLTKDAKQDLSNDVAPWPCCQQKLLGNGSYFCYWCKTLKSAQKSFSLQCSLLFSLPLRKCQAELLHACQHTPPLPWLFPLGYVDRNGGDARSFLLAKRPGKIKLSRWRDLRLAWK